jgi:hypothetical protein
VGVREERLAFLVGALPEAFELLQVVYGRELTKIRFDIGGEIIRQSSAWIQSLIVNSRVKADLARRATQRDK